MMEKWWQQYVDKRKRLDKLAEEDRYYRLLRKDVEDASEKFHKFASFMPRYVRNFLYGYADGQRMMLERKLSIACMCMDENGKTPRDWNAERRAESANKSPDT